MDPPPRTSLHTFSTASNLLWQKTTTTQTPMQLLPLTLLGRDDWVIESVVLLSTVSVWVRRCRRPGTPGQPGLGLQVLASAWRSPLSSVIGGRLLGHLTASSPSSQHEQTNQKDGLYTPSFALLTPPATPTGQRCLLFFTDSLSPIIEEFAGPSAGSAFATTMDRDPIKQTPSLAPTSDNSSSASTIPLGRASDPSRPPLPAEHIGTPKEGAMTSPVRTSFDVAELRQPQSSRPPHNRSMSLADVAVQSKRLSLHFPVQTGNLPLRSPPLRSGRPTSWALDSIASSLGEVAKLSPTEGNFLTVIASQERRVLELKDELKQAEEELKRLKDHYRKHEAFKKRNETVRRVHQLEPLSVSIPTGSEGADDDTDGSSLWMQREMERRKVLLSGVKSSNRKVFSGSRHTRALSLLSPERMQAPPFPRVNQDENENNEDGDEIKGLPSIPRSATLDLAYGSPDLDMSGGRSPTDQAIPSTITREALLKTGKQMAADLKEGLWTFVEDLRQATVGEEGVNGTTSRSDGTKRATNTNSSTRPSNSRNPSAAKGQGAGKKASNAIANDVSALIDIGGSFWRENGVESAENSPVPKKKSSTTANSNISSIKPTAQRRNRPDSKILTPRKATQNFDDSWDTWDTPVSQAAESVSSSTTASISSSSNEDDDEDDDDETSNQSSARTSSSLTHDRSQKVAGLLKSEDANGRQDGIPWPTLVKLSPSHLTRTASHLMNEWEKSLSSPPAEKTEAGGYLEKKGSGKDD